MQQLYFRCLYLALIFSVSLFPSFSYGQGAPDCAAAVVLCSSGSISFNPQGIGGVDDFASGSNSPGLPGYRRAQYCLVLF